jgi:hypothetical protein
MATPSTTLTVLAQQAAAEIGFTVRRWWRDAADPSVLRVEVERRLVGAPPAIAQLTVTIPVPQARRRATPAPPIATKQMSPTTPAKRPAPRLRRTARARQK